MQYVAMTMNSWPNVNPGFRVFYLDKDDYTVLDYDQYYMNLMAVKNGQYVGRIFVVILHFRLCFIQILTGAVPVGGGGCLGSQGPPPPLLGTSQLEKEGKMPHVLVLNSYPDPPPTCPKSAPHCQDIKVTLSARDSLILP